MNKSEFLRRFHHVRHVTPVADFPLKYSGKPAAVLIPIVERESGLTLLLTERAYHLKHHPGQISFPGGKVEQHDNTLSDAAARETFEEIGIPKDKLEWIGVLPKYRTVSHYEIVPFVAFVSSPFSLDIDNNEVASVFEVPLHEVCQPKHQLVYTASRNGVSHPIYFIPYQQYMIWGATAAIIRNLTHHLYDIQD